MRGEHHQRSLAKSSVFLYGNISTKRIFRGSENEWYGLGCGLDVRGCGSDMDNKADRSSSHSILRGRLGSGIDNRRNGYGF